MIDPEKLKKSSLEELYSALYGCSLELSLCGVELTPEPGEEFATREELEADMAFLQSEILQRTSSMNS